MLWSMHVHASMRCDLNHVNEGIIPVACPGSLWFVYAIDVDRNRLKNKAYFSGMTHGINLGV